MSLNSTSTIADAEAAYKDNLSYSTDGSAAKCRLFIEACRFLLAFQPKSVGSAGDAISLNPELVAGELAEAKAWLAANDSSEMGPRVVRGSFRNFR